MTQKFLLQPLLERSHHELEEATRTLGELMAAEQESHQKLEVLQKYRYEYQNQFAHAARDGLSPAQWKNFSAFLARIDEAISAQQNSVDIAQNDTRAGKQHWVDKRNRRHAFDTLRERHRQAEQQQQNKAEQRQSDEHAARAHRRQQQEH